MKPHSQSSSPEPGQLAPPNLTAWQALRRRVGIRPGALFDNLLHGAAAIGRLGPWAWPSVHELEVVRDLRYSNSGLAEHTLDIYRPRRSKANADAQREALPVVFYIHGGAFASLSKDTHWPIALMFARKGYLVCSINYRLAPRHRFPAALADCCQALDWLRREGPGHGADLGQLILAGESAGANLATALALAMSSPRPEPYAAPLYIEGEGQLRPLAVLASCGLMQVSNCQRLLPGGRGPTWIAELIEMVDGYLPASRADQSELMDPLLGLERMAAQGEQLPRPLPPFFVCAGTADPLLEDSRRLVRVLGQLGVPCEAQFSDGEPHAYHALLWRRQAQECWQATFDFLSRVRREKPR